MYINITNTKAKGIFTVSDLVNYPSQIYLGILQKKKKSKPDVNVADLKQFP